MSITEPCRLCLSTERAMISIENVRWAYNVLTETTRNVQSGGERASLAAARVCWVCHAALRRLLRLRSQALHAQWTLASHANVLIPPQCLSSLSCFTKTYIDRDFKEDMKYWTIDKDNQSLDTEEGIKSEIAPEAVDFDVFTESVSSDTIDPNIMEVKVKEINCKVEVKAESSEDKKKSPIKVKCLQKNTKPLASDGRTEKVVRRRRSKLETKPQEKVIKQVIKKTAKKLDISKLCENVLNATREQLIEKRDQDNDKKSCYRCVVCELIINGEEESLWHLEGHRSKGSCSVLRCRLCAHLTGDADAMRRHHEVSHPPAARRTRAAKSTVANKSMSGYDCSVCGLHLNTYDSYRVHCKTHTHPRTYQCDICKATYALRNQILVHLKMHDKRFLCDICGKTFKDKKSLSIHFLCHSSIDSRPYACKLCPRKFITKDKLAVHATIHDGIKLFKCDLCDSRFWVKFQLTRHKKLRHSTAEPVEKKKMTRTKSLFRNEKLLIDEKTNEIRVPIKQQIFQCNLCGKKYARKKNLEVHAVFHTGEKPHKCDECDMAFKYAAGLWAHKLLHRGVKPHHCTVCGAQFTLKGNLKGHMKIHTNDKPYKCDICGQRFPWRKNLKNHFKVHAK